MAAQVLEANFGGINKALAETPQGKMTILQHEIAGLKTSVGNDLIAAFGGVGGAVIKMVQAVEPLITAFFDKVAALAEKIGPPLEKCSVVSPTRSAKSISAASWANCLDCPALSQP